jgi:hypothetical protein
MLRVAVRPLPTELVTVAICSDVCARLATLAS